MLVVIVLVLLAVFFVVCVCVCVCARVPVCVCVCVCVCMCVVCFCCCLFAVCFGLLGGWGGGGMNILHFLEEVSVGHSFEFLQNQVDAAADEERFMFLQSLIQLQQVARTASRISRTVSVLDDSHHEYAEEEENIHSCISIL